MSERRFLEFRLGHYRIPGSELIWIPSPTDLERRAKRPIDLTQPEVIRMHRSIGRFARRSNSAGQFSN